MENMKYKAVIFDLDGTLINSVDDLGTSVNRVLELNNFPTHELEDYNNFIGDGAEMMVRRALPEDKRDEQTVERCLGQFLDDYFKNYCVHTRPYPGIKNLLNTLEEKSIKFAVLTNKPNEVSVKIVSELFPERHFEMVLGQKNDLPRKPDPTGALIISKIINVNPGEIVYLGDSGVDMETAKSAGMLSVGVLWGFRGYDELKNHGADLLINSPAEILDLVEFTP